MKIEDPTRLRRTAICARDITDGAVFNGEINGVESLYYRVRGAVIDLTNNEMFSVDSMVINAVERDATLVVK